MRLFGFFKTHKFFKLKDKPSVPENNSLYYKLLDCSNLLMSITPIEYLTHMDARFGLEISREIADKIPRHLIESKINCEGFRKESLSNDFLVMLLITEVKKLRTKTIELEIAELRRRYKENTIISANNIPRAIDIL
jgi:hypothetical protein